MSRIDDQRQSIFFQSDKNSGKIVEAQKRKQIAFMCCIYVYIFFFTKTGKRRHIDVPIYGYTTQVHRYNLKTSTTKTKVIAEASKIQSF